MAENEEESKDESTEEDVKEEKEKIKDLGLENMSKSGFDRLFDGSAKKKEEKKKEFRGFT